MTQPGGRAHQLKGHVVQVRGYVGEGELWVAVHSDLQSNPNAIGYTRPSLLEAIDMHVVNFQCVLAKQGKKGQSSSLAVRINKTDLGRSGILPHADAARVVDGIIGNLQRRAPRADHPCTTAHTKFHPQASHTMLYPPLRVSLLRTQR